MICLGLEAETTFSVALLLQPKIVFLLDEPTGGVDPITRRYLGNDLCRGHKGTTLFVNYI
jgi:ABC-2 type transport system ATP-binding protein